MPDFQEAPKKAWPGVAVCLTEPRGEAVPDPPLLTAEEATEDQGNKEESHHPGLARRVFQESPPPLFPLNMPGSSSSKSKGEPRPCDAPSPRLPASHPTELRQRESAEGRRADTAHWLLFMFVYKHSFFLLSACSSPGEETELRT